MSLIALSSLYLPKIINFINAFACYKQKCKLVPFNLALPVYSIIETLLTIFIHHQQWQHTQSKRNKNKQTKLKKTVRHSCRRKTQTDIQIQIYRVNCVDISCTTVPDVLLPPTKSIRDTTRDSENWHCFHRVCLSTCVCVYVCVNQPTTASRMK